MRKENMREKNKRKWSKITSSKNYDNLNHKIQIGWSTFWEIQEKKIALQKNMQIQKPKQQEESIYNFGKVLFSVLKEADNNCKIANTYLFKLSQDIAKSKKLYDGLYKIEVVKKDNKGIICKISWSGNFNTTIAISNEKIMDKKEKEDTLEDIVYIQKTFFNEKGERATRKRPGKKEDFLQEIQYKDSVIIDIKKWKTRKIDPESIVDEIKTYIKKETNEQIKAKKIQTAMTFLNDSKNKIAEEYKKEFLIFMKTKQKKRQGKDNKEYSKKAFAEVLKRYINTQKNYIHKGSDIDKSALQFLLKKLWIKQNVFEEIGHNDIKNIHQGIFRDVGGSVHGIKSSTADSNPQTTKTIVSEHTDGSDEALLHNRPTSTTHMIFALAKELDIINKDDIPQMERFIQFIDIVDSMDYQVSSIDYPNNYQTLFGLYRKMKIEDIYKYFTHPNNNGFEKIPSEYMKKINTQSKNTTIPLNEASQKQKRRIENNIKNFQRLKDNKQEFEYKQTKYIVDLKWEILDGAQTAWYHGYGYFTIGQERGNIYMYSPKKLPFMAEGFHTDGHFLIINNPNEENILPLINKFYCDENTKKTILDTIEKKHNKNNIHNIIDQKTQLLLWTLEQKTLKVGKSYPAVINNITNKIIYVNLDKEGRIKGMIRCESKEEAKKFIRGNIVHIQIQEIKNTEKYPFIIGKHIPKE